MRFFLDVADTALRILNPFGAKFVFINFKTNLQKSCQFFGYQILDNSFLIYLEFPLLFDQNFVNELFCGAEVFSKGIRQVLIWDKDGIGGWGIF